MPRELPQEGLAELFAGAHALMCSHPESGKESHQCVGRLTVTRRSVVARCPLCGDSKHPIPEDRPPDGD